MNYQFGQGKVIVRPYNSAGVAGSPIELGTLQDASVEFKVNTKKLYGSARFPVSIADGEGEIPLSAKSAVFYGNAFNLVVGGSATNGGRTTVNDEIGLVATAMYTVASTATFVANTSVVYFTPTGGITRPMAITTGAPVSGVSYTEGAGGVLGFATADNGGTVRVSYIVSLTSGQGGQTIAIGNPTQNTSLGAQVMLTNQSINRQNNKLSTMILVLNSVILPNLKLDFKSGDFTIPEYMMDVSADQNNQIGTLYLTNYDNN